MDERLNMSNGDIDRLRIIRNTIDGKLKWSEASKMLELGKRQVGRLCAQVRSEGNRGILHGLRGQPSNNRLDEELLGQALSALHNPLWDGFGPGFSQEKLDGYYGIRLGKTTVRNLMILTNLWVVHRRGTRHRAWRERRACVGMLVQLDGSDHDWFEGRGPRCVLIIYIDDATSRILYGEFVHVEDTLTLMRTTKTYLDRWGRPVAYYVDKDSVYNINRQAAIEEYLRDEQPMTQFKRAMSELGVEVILANSPQAKGRVERGFETHQDRLVKELRLAGISTMEQANQFLWKVYIPEHNRRFAVDPAEPVDVHKALLPGHDLDAILAIQIQRQVQNDFTIRHRNRFYQLEEKQPVRLYRKADITVQEHLDGSMHLVFKNRALAFHPIAQRPFRPRCAASKPSDPTGKHPWPNKPPLDHSWRRYAPVSKRLQPVVLGPCYAATMGG
ncbi:MAG: ISNCY family transposase [Chloroflexota bacterium]